MSKGLNIIEAVKSGRKFRRPGGAWLADYSSITISKESILADDWEIEERKIEITESELNEAFLNAVCTVKAEAMLDSFKKKAFREIELVTDKPPAC